MVNILDEFVCDAVTTIQKSQKCDGVYDCQGEDENQWNCEHLQMSDESKFKSSSQSAYDFHRIN